MHELNPSWLMLTQNVEYALRFDRDNVRDFEMRSYMHCATINSSRMSESGCCRP
jgi:hypothetical protein